MLRVLLSDKLIWLLLLTFGLAAWLPVGDAHASAAGTISNIGIFILFLLNGIRLPRDEVLHGVKNWRLQGGVFLWVFCAMAAAGWGLSHIFAPLLPATLVLGLLYLGCLPSTVQSATSYTTLARGNVAASVIAAAFINLVGVVATPALFAALGSAKGVVISGEVILRIATILLLPFAIGQIIQPWVRARVMAYKDVTGWLDRLVIALAVYVALSAAVREGLWSQLPASVLLTLAAAISLFLAFAFGGAWVVSGGFARPDRKAFLFAGAHKSIAIGAPLAAILFPKAQAGFILVPVILYHLAQLILSAPIATHLAREE